MKYVEIGEDMKQGRQVYSKWKEEINLKKNIDIGASNWQT